MAKRPPAVQETWVRSLSQEDLLEEEMATHSSILAWRIPWMEELGVLHPTDRKESDTTERLHFHFHTLIRSIKLKKSKYECVLNKHLTLKCRSKR